MSETIDLVMGLLVALVVAVGLVAVALLFVADGWGSELTLRRVKVLRKMTVVVSAVALICLVVLVATHGFPTI